MQAGEYSHQRLVKEAFLSKEDMTEVIRRRGDYNRLGFAYQIGFTRLLNRQPTQRPLEIDEALLTVVALQLDIEADQIDEYATRQHTVSDHQSRVREFLQCKRFGSEEAKELEEFLFEESCRLERTAQLKSRAEQCLKRRSILQPADSTLLRIIGERRKYARENIFERIALSLPDHLLLQTLDDLLEVKPGESVSVLQSIKENPKRPSPDAMIGLLMKKLAVIEATGVLGVDRSWLNSNYQRALFHYVKKSWVDRLRRTSSQRRHAALTCFLWRSYRDAVDQSVDMFDKLLSTVQSRAKRQLDDEMKEQRRTISQSLSALKAIGEIVLDESSMTQSCERVYLVLFPDMSLQQGLNVPPSGSRERRAMSSMLSLNDSLISGSLLRRC